MNWTRMSDIHAIVTTNSRIEIGDSTQVRSIQYALNQSGMGAQKPSPVRIIAQTGTVIGERVEGKQKYAKGV